MPKFALLPAACAALLIFASTPAPAADRTLPPAWTSFARTWSGIAGYSATVTVFEQKGERSQNMVFDYSYHKPSNATVRIVQGSNAGVTLVWNGGTTMQAHRSSGLLSGFKKTLSIDDPNATTIRGSSIDQLSFDAILEHALETPGWPRRFQVLDRRATTDSGPAVRSEANGLTLETSTSRNDPSHPYASSATKAPRCPQHRLFGRKAQPAPAAPEAAASVCLIRAHPCGPVRMEKIDRTEENEGSLQGDRRLDSHGVCFGSTKFPGDARDDSPSALTAAGKCRV